MSNNDLLSTGQLFSQALESIYNPEYSTDMAAMGGSLDFTGSSMDYIEGFTAQPQQNAFNHSHTTGTPPVPVESGKVPSQQQTTGSTHSDASKAMQGKRNREDGGDASDRDAKRMTSTDLSSELNDNNLQKHYNVDVSNRFSFLNEELPEVPVEVKKIPPIYLTGISNHTDFIIEIKSKITENFTTQLKNNKIKIQFTTITDFRAAVKYFINSNKQFHTYSDPSVKKYSIVIKNIHPTIPENEILEDIALKFPSVTKVTRLNKNNVPIPVVAVEFNGTEKIESVLELKYICNSIVKPERRKKTVGPIQCYRCLDFGHSRNNCNYQVSCVFCAKNHLSANCPSKESTHKCKNCMGKHRADLRSNECSYYRKIIENNSNNLKSRSSDPRSHQSRTPPPNHDSTNFPFLPTTNNIPNFTQRVNYNNQPMNSNNANHQQYYNHRINNQFNQYGNNNTFITSIAQFITNHVVNLINSLIPTIIQHIQNSIASTFSNSYGRFTP